MRGKKTSKQKIHIFALQLYIALRGLQTPFFTRIHLEGLHYIVIDGVNPSVSPPP